MPPRPVPGPRADTRRTSRLLLAADPTVHLLTAAPLHLARLGVSGAYLYAARRTGLTPTSAALDPHDAQRWQAALDAYQRNDPAAADYDPQPDYDRVTRFCAAQLIAAAEHAPSHTHGTALLDALRDTAGAADAVRWLARHLHVHASALLASPAAIFTWAAVRARD